MIMKISQSLKYIPTLALIAVFHIHSIVFAQGLNSGPGTTGGGINSGPGQVNDPAALQNPLRVSTVNELLVAILNVLIVIAVPIVVIFIILAGFKYVTARGNQNDIQDAHRALTYAVIGAVLIIGALAIAEIISNLVAAF